MRHNDYKLSAPPVLRDFLVYHETIQGHSKKTVDEYYLDLRNFFRYIKMVKGKAPRTAELDEIPIDDLDLELVTSVTLSDVYAYMNYLSRDRAKHANSPSTRYGLEATARARKIAAIRSFYKYLTSKAKLLGENPMQNLDSPRLKKSLPRYLSLDESIQLLESVDEPNQARDYCILTLFLNCGLRISELVSLNLQDVREEQLRVLGKGNKERMIFLNDACRAALDDCRADFAEGAVGAGRGMRCHGLKGGIGSASRRLELDGRAYHLGALVLSNHARFDDLILAGVPIRERLAAASVPPHQDRGSIITVLATDAPLTCRQLGRVARRAIVGLSRTGSYCGNGSGEIVIAFSTGYRIPHYPQGDVVALQAIHEDRIDLFFRAAAECVEESVLSSLLHAETVTGRGGRTVRSLADLLREAKGEC